MKKLLLTFSVMLMALFSFSQNDVFTLDTNEPTINIQRPTFSESANVLQGTPIQFENGAFVLDTNDVAYQSLLRFRVNDRIELRSQTDWYNGFNVGAKVLLFNSDDQFMPDVSVQSFFTQNVGTFMATDYRVAATFDDMVDRLGVTFNYGRGFVPQRMNGMENYFIAAASYQLLDRLSAFAEVQMVDEDTNYNVGFIAFANNNWAVDIRGGSMAMGGDTQSFFGGGVSFAVR